MEILVLLIPLSIVLVGLAGWAFIWAVNNRQFDDLDKQAMDILMDDTGSEKK
ncbi:MAG: cbb3-type cytochrome oxidase assembly protein CcoS [bacterium]